MTSSPERQTAVPRPLLILGVTGTLGRAFARVCQARGIPHELAGRDVVDLARPLTADAVLERTNARAVVNTAGYVRVDDGEREPELVHAVNAAGPGMLAAACARRGVPLVAFSSDLVFDGSQPGIPYTESARVQPLNVYGRSKAAMEELVLTANPASLVIRTSSFFGPWDQANFVYHALRALRSGAVFEAASDTVMSPTYVPDLVHASLELLERGERGIWHVANLGAVSWSELASRAATAAGVASTGVRPRRMHELGLAAVRPAYSVLQSERGCALPSLDDALVRYLHAVER